MTASTTNRLPLLALCVATCLSVAGPGCNRTSEPAAEQPKKFRPVDEAETAAAANSAGTPALRPAAGASSSELATQFQTPASEVPASAPASQAASKPSAEKKSAQAEAKAGEPTGELLATLQQIDRLAQQQPEGTTQQEQLESLLRIQAQRLALAKKAMSLKPPADIRLSVARAMHEIYQVNVQLRIPNALSQLTDFAKSMAADPDANIARIGRHAEFTANISRIASQPVENGQANGKEIATEAKKLLDAEGKSLSDETQELVGQTADMLTQSGFKDDAAGLIEALAVALEGDEKQAAQAGRYKLIARLVRADFDKQLNELIQDAPGAAEKLIQSVQTILKEVPPGRDLMSRTQTVAHLLESTGHYQEAQTCFDAIVAAFANVQDPELADAKDLAATARLRMGLVGQPLVVAGVLPDGRPFDWSPYAGKVVLVDFWASWCGPCIEELPNIKQNFEQFHSKGFEVLGVNLNTNLADLKQFLTFQNLPWTTITSQEVLDGKVADDDWTRLPMAAKCGVRAIPFVLLIGKDGKVDSIHVRGGKLKDRLTALLGEPITTEVPADPTQAAPAATPTTPGGTAR